MFIFLWNLYVRGRRPNFCGSGMIHWATPVLPHTKLLWRRATFMTSQTAVFANPFVTSQRAPSDNPIDDVTDSTVLNARQPRSPTSGAASSIEHYEIGTICLEYWRQISNDGEVIDRHHDIRIMWGMYASSYRDVKRGYVTNWIIVFDRQHNLVTAPKSRLLVLLNFVNMMHVDCERFNMVCVKYCILFALL